METDFSIQGILYRLRTSCTCGNYLGTKQCGAETQRISPFVQVIGIQLAMHVHACPRKPAHCGCRRQSYGHIARIPRGHFTLLVVTKACSPRVFLALLCLCPPRRGKPCKAPVDITRSLRCVINLCSPCHLLECLRHTFARSHYVHFFNHDARLTLSARRYAPNNKSTKLLSHPNKMHGMLWHICCTSLYHHHHHHHHHHPHPHHPHHPHPHPHHHHHHYHGIMRLVGW